MEIAVKWEAGEISSRKSPTRYECPFFCSPAGRYENFLIHGPPAVSTRCSDQIQSFAVTSLFWDPVGLAVVLTCSNFRVMGLINGGKLCEMCHPDARVTVLILFSPVMSSVGLPHVRWMICRLELTDNIR